jgi:hypothetical protein
MTVEYLPVTVTDLPVSFVFQPDGAMREKVSRALSMKVVRVIAGAEKCNVVVDIKRPYFRAIAPELDRK